jgi:hypothetical protein
MIDFLKRKSKIVLTFSKNHEVFTLPAMTFSSFWYENISVDKKGSVQKKSYIKMQLVLPCTKL